MRRVVWLVVALVLVVGSVGVARADSVTTTVNADKVYFVLPDRDNLMIVTLMWLKKTSDLDLVIFGDDPPPNGLIVGVGFGTEPQYESLSLGAVEGADTYVVLTKASGPGSKAILNIQTSAGEGFVATDGSRSGIRYLGTLDELALSDPRFERMQEQVDQLKKAKQKRLAN